MESSNSRHDVHLRRAIALSREHALAGDGGPFGAVIVRGDTVVAEGWNLVTSTFDPTAHAEVTAIRRACQTLRTFSLAGCVMYTSCEPCPMCFGAIHWARLDAMVYGASRHDAAAIGFDDALLYQEVCLPLAMRSLPTSQRLAREAREAMDAWAAWPERICF